MKLASVQWLKSRLAFVIFFCALSGVFPNHLLAKSNQWMSVDIGIIGMASAEILHDALEEAKQSKSEGLILVLDTPGGVLDTTREMVQLIMDSPIPVVVWVGPSGARAGSAGAFITIAAHIASMAPGTNIGAAHPVDSSGKDIDEEEMNRKVENDTIAFMEAIAEARGRNKEMTTSFVLNSVSITAKEALEHHVIDFVVDDTEALLKLIDGREVKLAHNMVRVLDTKDTKIRVYEKSLRQRFLEILANPNLFYLLFIAGLIGIGFELTHPGVMVPGVVGGICILLALIATSVLPVSFGAMLLVLLGIVFLVAEAFVPSFGALGIGGIAGFVIGSFLLIDPGNQHGLRISIWTIAPMALFVTGFAFLVFYLVVRTERSRVTTGGEGIIGQIATVRQPFKLGKGRVNIDGEIWDAMILGGEDSTFVVGEDVRVKELRGLVLVVEKLEDSGV